MYRVIFFFWLLSWHGDACAFCFGGPGYCSFTIFIIIIKNYCIISVSSAILGGSEQQWLPPWVRLPPKIKTYSPNQVGVCIAKVIHAYFTKWNNHIQRKMRKLETRTHDPAIHSRSHGSQAIYHWNWGLVSKCSISVPSDQFTSRCPSERYLAHLFCLIKALSSSAVDFHSPVQDFVILKKKGHFTKCVGEEGIDALLAHLRISRTNIIVWRGIENREDIERLPTIHRVVLLREKEN